LGKIKKRVSTSSLSNVPKGTGFSRKQSEIEEKGGLNSLKSRRWGKAIPCPTEVGQSFSLSIIASKNISLAICGIAVCIRSRQDTIADSFVDPGTE